jgi:hypothetical protein
MQKIHSDANCTHFGKANTFVAKSPLPQQKRFFCINKRSAPGAQALLPEAEVLEKSSEFDMSRADLKLVWVNEELLADQRTNRLAKSRAWLNDNGELIVFLIGGILSGVSLIFTPYPSKAEYTVGRHIIDLLIKLAAIWIICGLVWLKLYWSKESR